MLAVDHQDEFDLHHFHEHVNKPCHSSLLKNVVERESQLGRAVHIKRRSVVGLFMFLFT